MQRWANFLWKVAVRVEWRQSVRGMEGASPRSMAHRTSVLALTIMLALTTSCRDRSESAIRRSEQFEQVTEGQAGGVAGTIAGPGESVPSLTPSPAVGTTSNVDTTTAFSILNETVAAVDPAATPQIGTLPEAAPVRAYPQAGRPPARSEAPRRVEPPRDPVPATSAREPERTESQEPQPAPAPEAAEPESEEDQTPTSTSEPPPPPSLASARPGL